MARKSRLLEIRLSRSIAEQPTPFVWASAERASIHEIESAVRRAAADDGIRALLLVMTELEIGWSHAESLHRAVLAFRRQGKPSVAFLMGGGNAAYMAAAACETIVLARSASLSLQALGSESLFLPDLLGDIGVEPELEAIGEFKSAGEPFERRESSEAHRLEIRAILEDLNDQFTARIADGRGLAIDETSELVLQGPFVPEDALAHGLVDHLGYEDSCTEILEAVLDGKPTRVPLKRYARRPGILKRIFRFRRPQVAVVYAYGVLATGDGRRAPGTSPIVNAKGLSEILSRLRELSRVKAIVLRVDSPGGGALASDVLHREIQLTKDKKPVIVSMGDVAASGGYYIAAAADAVVAEGTTLTGSIGVIGGKIALHRLLDRLGIHRETMALGPNARMFSPLHPFTPEQRTWHRHYLEHFYRERFLPVVAAGRKLSIAEADDAGRGRVWTGRQGVGNGLVDVLGGLEDAIDLAFEKVSLPRAKSRVVVYARRTQLRDLLTFGPRTWAAPSLGLADVAGLVQELAREELLLLMPTWFRIR